MFRGRWSFRLDKRFNELNRRSQIYVNNSGSNFPPTTEPSSEPQTSAMTPRWIDGHLLLLRRVLQNGRVSIQGCELDWDGLQQDLRAEISDLLSDARIEPVADADPFGRRASFGVPACEIGARSAPGGGIAPLLGPDVAFADMGRRGFGDRRHGTFAARGYSRSASDEPRLSQP